MTFGESAALDVLAKPTMAIYRDIDAYPATCINLSFSHSLKLYKEVTLDLGAAFGYLAGHGKYFQTYENSTEDYTGTKYNGFHDGMVKAGITVPITKALTIKLRIEY